MTYIRHRQRMIQESIFEDLRNTLIACRWHVGATTRTVINPATQNLEIVTTDEEDIYAFLTQGPVEMLDAFPDSPEMAQPNKLAMDFGVAGESDHVEMGNRNLREQPYIFSIGLLMESDAAGSALLSDLRDRYEGRLVHPDAIPLYDYLTDPSAIAGYLDIEVFRWIPDPQSSTRDARLFMAELQVIDLVDGVVETVSTPTYPSSLLFPSSSTFPA